MSQRSDERTVMLPENIGINQRHHDLKFQLLERFLVMLESESLQLKSYAISEDYGVVEQIKLELPDNTINIQVSKR